MSRRAEWVWALAAAVLLSVLAAAAVLVETEANGPPYSTYTATDDGLSLIHDLLAERGDRPGRWQGPLEQLPEAADVLVTWEPVDLTPEAWQAMKGWAAAGRTLVVAASPRQFAEWEEAGWPHRYPPDVHPATELRPRRLSPLTLGVSRVESRWDPTAAEPNWLHPVEPELVSAGGRTVAYSWREGQGRVIAFVDPNWLTNGYLPRADSLRLALQLLGDRRVSFDEYHHGFRAAAAPGAWRPEGRLPRLLAWQLVLAALLYLAFRSGRFGMPWPPPEMAPRHAAEFAEAMGNLYRQARARTVVLATARRSLVHLLRRLGAGADAGPEQLGRTYAARTGRPAVELVDLLQELDENSSPTEARLLELARRAELAQRRMEHGRDRNARGGGTGP